MRQTTFEDEKLEDKKKFALNYLLKAESPRIFNFLMRQRIFDVGDDYIVRYVFWCSPRGSGFIRMWESSEMENIILPTIRNANNLSEDVILAFVEDDFSYTNNQIVNDWYKKGKQSGIYRVLLPAEFNPLNPAMAELHNRVINEIEIYSFKLITTYFIEDTWKEEARRLDGWPNFQQCLKEVSLFNSVH